MSLVLFLPLLLAPLPSCAAPLPPGLERAVYQLRWGIIPAGEVVIETRWPAGTEATRVHTRLTARSLPHLDFFYKVRDRIDAVFDGQRSVAYEKDQREGHTRRRVSLAFDWQAGTVTYRNFDEVLAPIPLEPGTVDPLSAYPFLRRQELAPGVEITRPVTDGKKCVVGRARVVAREEVATPAGRFQTLVVVPDTRDIGGVFEKSRDATMHLWLTDDGRHLLVRAASRVAVGSIVAELVAYQPPAP